MVWDDLDFTDPEGGRVGTPAIRIYGFGTIMLNAPFMRAANLLGAKYVAIAYSKDNHAIVFQFFNESQEERKVFKLTTRKVVRKRIDDPRIDYRQVSPHSFFKVLLEKYGLSHTAVAGRYLPKEEDIPSRGKVWVIYLAK